MMPPSHLPRVRTYPETKVLVKFACYMALRMISYIHKYLYRHYTNTMYTYIYIYAVDIDIPELTNVTWSIRTKTPTNEVQGDARRWSLVCGERIASMQIWEMPICLYTFGWSNVTQQFIWLHIFVGWFNFWILATPMIWPCSSSTRDKGQGGL